MIINSANAIIIAKNAVFVKAKGKWLLNGSLSVNMHKKRPTRDCVDLTYNKAINLYPLCFELKQVLAPA